MFEPNVSGLFKVVLLGCMSPKKPKRPILRGRDIKRYGYSFADLWLIATFPAKHYNIDDYPAVKRYLQSYGERKLAQSGEKDID